MSEKKYLFDEDQFNDLAQDFGEGWSSRNKLKDFIQSEILRNRREALESVRPPSEIDPNYDGHWELGYFHCEKLVNDKIDDAVWMGREDNK